MSFQERKIICSPAQAFELLKIGLFKFPPLLVLKYLSSKTNFVFDQTLFTLLRERCAVITPSYFF